MLQALKNSGRFIMAEQERKLVDIKVNTVEPVRQKEGKQKYRTLSAMLQRLGNRNVQRILQRSGDKPYNLDDETSSRINSERGAGAPLENQLQMQMSERMGFDLSGVRVHTSSSSDQLNQRLNARAFTTGQDIFFRSGTYNPETSSGKELISHELTHVVQQGTGQVQGQGGMTVNAPGDRFEQEADRVAANLKDVTPSPAAQTQSVAQRNGMPEEEELAQTQTVAQRNGMPEEEELAQTDALQRQDPEEEELADL
jgi:hypothetical protein